MEQKDLINGVMFVLKREVLPSVAVSYFSNTQNLIDLVKSISLLNAFTIIPDFEIEFSSYDCFGYAIGVVEACCNLLQAVCERFPLSCTVEETRGAFFDFAQTALPYEEGHITITPKPQPDDDEESETDYDDVPSRSASEPETDPVSVMYMAALRLDATLVKHVSSQLGRSFQQQRLRDIMLAVYRKTTVESRVKSKVLSCILEYYDLACFTQGDTAFVAEHVLQWNSLATFLNNIPSVLVAIEFMDKMISAPYDQVARDVRIPFLNLSFS
jgi:hypothetical protein